MGYMIDIIRNVSDDTPSPLPDWSDFGDKFIKGLIIWLAGMIYAIPAIILFGFPFAISLISSITRSSDYGEAMAGALAGVGILLACLFILYFVAFSFLFPAVNINFARHGNFSSCFQLREIFQLVSENIGNYAIAWLVAIVFGFAVGAIASIIIAFLGIIPCLGWILAWGLGAFVTVWISVVYAHLFGQVAAEAHRTPAISTEENMVEDN
jgi:hypothetical protein